MIARKYGVVYTPDRLADFAAELLCAEIEKSEFDSVNVLDPACGECALLDSVKKIKRNEYEYIGIDVDKSAILSASSEYTIINNDTILPKNVRKRTAEFWTGKLPTINAVIANPPWSSEKIYNRDDLRKAGYELTAGQYDSFVLFLELAYKIVCENGIFAFIIPDSIFDSQNENLRRFLIRNTEIKVIARLGEKLFDEVNRATPYILDKVHQMIGDAGTVADIMAGTGTVSLELRKKGYKVVASDVMTYSYHHLNVNLCMKEAPEFIGLKDVITDDLGCMYLTVLKYLNQLEPKKSFFYQEFSPDGTPRNGTPPRKYFTSDNAMRIDAMREKINEWIDAGNISKSEESLLKHTLIMAVNEVANISGTYGYFLSSFKKNSLEKIELKPIDF